MDSQGRSSASEADLVIMAHYDDPVSSQCLAPSGDCHWILNGSLFFIPQSPANRPTPHGTLESVHAVMLSDCCGGTFPACRCTLASWKHAARVAPVCARPWVLAYRLTPA